MSARKRNLNFLKRCGYQTEYHVTDHEISINCSVKNELPELKIILKCRPSEEIFKGAVRRSYAVESARCIYLKSKNQKEFKSTGTVIDSRGDHYLIPGKEIIDEILPMVDQQGSYKYLWKLAREILNQGNEYISRSRARQIFENTSEIEFTHGKINHPLVFTGIDKVSFISRSMLEYCLAIELNKKDENSRELKEFISMHTFEFLDYDRKLAKQFSPIAELKEEAIRLQKYEKAAELRDLEKSLQAEYLRRTWPNLSVWDAKILVKEKLEDLKRQK